jgi:DtxR family Mn-dependent transcriptional regulator
MSEQIIYLLVFFLIVITGALLWSLGTKGLLTGNTLKKTKTQVEDILKLLYHVNESGKSAGISELSNALRIKTSRILFLVEHMSSLGLVEVIGPDLKLTESGVDYALRIIRVHRLYEKYLSERTGFDKLEWHQRAEKMEHQLSTSQTEELARKLGFPRFDPHGDPIPTAKGELVEVVSLPLSSFKEGVEGKIVHIEDEPEVIYRQIINKGLHVGSQLKVLRSDDRDIHFYSEGKEYSMSSLVAANINVVELTEEEIFEENSTRLADLKQGENAKVIGISKECRGPARRRLLDLGFIPGTELVAEMVSPMNNPKAFLLRNTLIALRDDQAEFVLVEKT